MSTIVPAETVADLVDTETFARLNRTAPRTVRWHWHTHGSFHGIKPTKLASGRILWPPQVAIAEGGAA